MNTQGGQGEFGALLPDYHLLEVELGGNSADESCEAAPVPTWKWNEDARMRAR